MASSQSTLQHRDQAKTTETERSPGTEAPSSSREESSDKYPAMVQGQSEPNTLDSVMRNSQASLNGLYFRDFAEHDFPVDASENILGPIHEALSRNDEQTWLKGRNNAIDLEHHYRARIPPPRDSSRSTLPNEQSYSPALSRYLTDSESNQPYHTIAKVMIDENAQKVRFQRNTQRRGEPGHHKNHELRRAWGKEEKEEVKNGVRHRLHRT